MTRRFNPPPGWPPAPRGWEPPPGWQPPADLPTPPPNWQWWIETRRSHRWLLVGGVAAAALAAGVLALIVNASSGNSGAAKQTCYLMNDSRTMVVEESGPDNCQTDGTFLARHSFGFWTGISSTDWQSWKDDSSANSKETCTASSGDRTITLFGGEFLGPGICSQLQQEGWSVGTS